MKYLIGFLFCLMLFTVGSVLAQEKILTEKATELCCLDTGKSAINIDGSQNRFFELFAKANDAFEKDINMKKLEEASRIASIQAFKQIGGYEMIKNLYKEKDALLARYRYVPDCPIVFVKCKYIRHQTHYSYIYTRPYNQPPSI